VGLLLLLLETELQLPLLELLQVDDDRAFRRGLEFLLIQEHADESESLLKYWGFLCTCFFVDFAVVLPPL
jgi:hypothetical protein